MQKVVIVTAAAGLIGRSIAKAFGDAGDKVVVSDLKNSEVETLAAQINQGPGEAFAYVANTLRYEEVKAMVDETVKRWGRVDAFASLVGGGLRRLTGKKEVLISDYTDEDWDLVVDTNLKGTFHCIKAVIGPMMKQKDGQIIIMGSGTGSKGKAKNCALAAAKAGLLGLMKTAALELCEHNIRVNVVAPGKHPHPGEDLKIENMLKKLSNPIEVGDFFVHLSRMQTVSGQYLNLDSRILF